MGLDIYHCKATLEKPADLNPLSENFVTLSAIEGFDHEFEGFDVGIDYFQDYIQTLELPKTVHTFIFLKEGARSSKNIDYFLNSFSQSDYHIVDEPAIDITDYILEFKHQHGLSHLSTHQRQTRDWYLVHLCEQFHTKGFYYEEVGYQRKGMNQHFSGKFYHQENYRFTAQSDFAFALSCVDYYWPEDTKEEIEQRIALFKHDFVDTYETNRSWMHVSY